MLPLTRVLVLAAAAVVATSQGAIAQPWSPQPFNPIPNVIKPFGYGSVSQYLSTTSTATGAAICSAHNVVLQCFEVSGGNSCGVNVPKGQVVSCGLSSKPPVDERNFQPVNCNGQALGDNGVSGLLAAGDWCLAGGYMPSRQKNTLYQFDDYVRLGVNTLFGGTVFELYGVDKIDRILQNGGGAVQLSLWAFNPQYANQAYPRGYFAIPANGASQCNTQLYATAAICSAANAGAACTEGVEGPNLANCPVVYPCSDSGNAAGSPNNPIQAVSQSCMNGAKDATVDSVASKAPGAITVTKANPGQFTMSNTYPVTWSQTTQVFGPYAMVTYAINPPTSVADMDFQEIPAIFFHGALGQQGAVGANLYYYGGANPYGDVAGPVSFINDLVTPVGAVELPNRAGPFGVGKVASLTEDWMSSCDVSGIKCVTVASFSSLTQDFIPSYNVNNSYLGIHGFFSITDGLPKTITVFLFPYRFDDVVMGMSIRAWIYQLHQNPIYRK